MPRRFTAAFSLGVTGGWPSAVRRMPIFLLLLAPMLAMPRPALAQAAGACPLPALAPQLDQMPDRTDAPIIALAQTLNAGAESEAELAGRVEISRADQLLSTSLLQYDPNTERARLPAPLRYSDAQLQLQASNGRYGFLEQSGDFYDVRYGFTGSSAQGGADTVHLSEGRRSELTGIWFTTCAGDQPDWMLSARELELQHDEGVGVARGAKLKLGRVPVLYLPYMTFPIDDRRKSGFLYPSLSTANDNGLEVAVPYYWNIAPQRDATVTPRLYSERGLMLGLEYRQLTARSYTTLAADVLPDDRKLDEQRWRYQADWRMAIDPSWLANAQLERVSDNDYFTDFGGNLAQTSRQYLRSQATLSGAGRYWLFTALLDDFQVLDDDVALQSQPYKRLPRLAFSLDAPLGRRGFGTTVEAEAVYFERDVGVTGARLDLLPSLVWSSNRAWGFFKAAAGYRMTGYELENTTPASDTSPRRGTAIVSLDSGLYLDRLTPSGSTQTLEPRIYYLYVPFEDQSELPDFDTSEFTFGFAQLFHSNRFTGADRQTDANQLTLALSTRTLNPSSGRESWSVNLGQIFYLTPPRVTLDEDTAVRPNSSPFLAELNWHPLDRLNTRLGVQWDWENRELDVGVAAIDYLTTGGSRLGFEYRYRRDRLDQFDVRYLWPLNERWSLYSRVNYSLADSELQEGLIGLEYESCCWALRVAARRYLKDRQGGTRDGLFVELRLKGLGAFGRRSPPLFYTPAP